MAWFMSLDMHQPQHGLMEASASFRLSMDEAKKLHGLVGKEFNFVPVEKWENGDQLKCVETEGAYSLQKNLVYTFDRYYNGKENRVVLKEFPKTSFDAGRFEKVMGLVTYGEPGKGKTILGKASGSMKLERTFSNGILSDMADAMGMSVASRPKAYAIEDKTSDHLYVHGNTTIKGAGLPVRRQRKGRKLVP